MKDGLIDKLFRIALVFLPFTSITGLSFLGEIKREVPTYWFLAAMALSAFPVLTYFRIGGERVRERVHLLPRLAFLLLAAIAISFVMNIDSIKHSFFHERSGIDKFVSATILVLYGLGLSLLTYFLAARQSWDKLIILPLAASVIICAVFSIFEMAAHMSGAMAKLFAVMSAPVYGDIGLLPNDMRLRSVAFEPPDFANTAGYIWPWLLAAVLYAKGTQRVIFAAIWLVLNIMIVLSEARTSFVVIGGLLGVFATLWFLFLPQRDVRDPDRMVLPLALVFAFVLPACLLLFVYSYDTLVASVVASDNVSNLSRLAAITSAFNGFLTAPFFGYGFGQSGFYYTTFLPSWGYYSWEIVEILKSGTVWPNAFCVYARLAVEMGVMGVALWLGLWLWLAYSLIVETMRYRKKTGLVPFTAMPLIMSCFCVLLAGIPCDSLRAPMIWINLGLACRYLYSMKQAKASA